MAAMATTDNLCHKCPVLEAIAHCRTVTLGKQIHSCPSGLWFTSEVLIALYSGIFRGRYPLQKQFSALKEEPSILCHPLNVILSRQHFTYASKGRATQQMVSLVSYTP